MRSFKKIVLILPISIFFLAGCSKTANDIPVFFGDGKTAESTALNDEWKAVKIKKETRYYNDYLGFSYAIPKGWWLYNVNEENFGKSRGDITDDISMDLYFNKYGDYSFLSVWFLAFGNLEKTDLDNHLGFDLDARSLDGVYDMAGFMKYFEAYMLESDDDVVYRLIDSRQISIKGKPFELREYTVTQSDYRDYNIVTLSCRVKEDYFLNIKIDYWADNTKAENAIIECVTKAIEFF